MAAAVNYTTVESCLQYQVSVSS